MAAVEALYEVERRAEHAARPGFRITELQISRTQKVPWHYHTNVQDTFYVLQGELRIFLQEPKEEVRLGMFIANAAPGTKETVPAPRCFTFMLPSVKSSRRNERSTPKREVMPVA